MEEIKFERGFSMFKIDSLNDAFKDLSFCIDKKYELANCYLWRGLIYLAYEQRQEACLDYKLAKKYGNIEADEWLNQDCK
jgi:tetratricopeptide (TPR) repeat protein